jgi:hypothetical protein
VCGGRGDERLLMHLGLFFVTFGFCGGGRMYLSRVNHQ